MRYGTVMATWRPSGSSATATCSSPPSTTPDSAVNAVDGRLHHDLGELFRDAEARRRSARAVVLTGSGGRSRPAATWSGSRRCARSSGRTHLRREGKQIIWDLLDVEVPIVCGLNGAAAGLGASIALLCDVIVMAEAAVIVDPHVKVGLVAGDGGAAIWPLLLGPLAAKRHLLLGDPLTAADALRLGVAAEVCPTPRSVSGRWPGPGASPPARRSPCRAPSRRSTPRSSRRC